ncbi:hypothetical protein YM80_004386 [Salmonella enterica subsp. salamae]|nr:hypothetical protein [Salmonella enterica subsp. salamae]
MKNIAIIISLGLASLNAYSADVPLATDTGTITVKGSAYSKACTTIVSSVSLTIPTTIASEYKAKGDMSPLSNSGITGISCTEIPGVYITVTGDPDSTDPSLFKIPDGTGKATGVALKLYVTAASNPITTVEPNKETALLPNPTSSNMGLTYSAQAVSIADTVTSGDLATTLTWTARYN